MSPRGRLLVLLLGLFWSGASVASEPVYIGVMEFVSKGGIAQDKADVLADMLTEEISHLGNVRVVNRSDIIEMLTLEKQKRLAGCTDKECLSEIGGALGVRWMVSGNVSRFGDVYLLNLKLIDVKRAQVSGRVARRIRGGEERLMEEISDAAQELFGDVAERLGLSLSERVTIAARHAQSISESPSAVTVIAREDIEASGATNLADLLRLVPGMDVILVSPAFTAVTARLIWTNENFHHLLLVDGREANIELLGQPFWELQPFSLGDIERIEVIRGPASSLYGANAFAGVVSITTRAIQDEPSLWLSLAGGEVAYTALNGRASTRIGNWGFSVSGGADLSGKFLDSRELGRRLWKVRSVVEHRWSDSERAYLDVGISDGTGPLSGGLGDIDGSLVQRTARLAYEARDLRGHIYWNQWLAGLGIRAPLTYGGIHMADMIETEVEGHTLHGDLQLTLTEPLDSFLVIVGGGGRVSWVGSDQFLDASTFADKESSRYHRPGAEFWEARGGAFLHVELFPAHWVTVTGGLRLDYNTATGEFASPRLASVFRLASGHYLRVGTSRAFRKPSCVELNFHPMVEFPEGSPFAGTAQDEFLEFMTKVVGNRQLEDEELWSIETGYLGRFFEDRLAVGVDLYWNLYRKIAEMDPKIVTDERGLPDLDQSSMMNANASEGVDVLGGEFSVRLDVSRSVALRASWSHRQVFDHTRGRRDVENPKNLITVGGRFWTEAGMLGSLYLFSRSDFWDLHVYNPVGIMEPLLKHHFENVFLLLGKIGWRWRLRDSSEFEAGVKLFLPVSPFSPPYFRYREEGGGELSSGKGYGGDELRRMLTFYLEGSF